MLIKKFKVYLLVGIIIPLIAAGLIAGGFAVYGQSFFSLQTETSAEEPEDLEPGEQGTDENTTELWEGSVNTENAWNSNNLIESAQDLADFAAFVNGGTNFSGKTVKLGANIDISGKVWTPIGNSSYSFQGTFDGNGYLISGLTINPTVSFTYNGLFGYTTNNAILKNIMLSGVNITLTSSSTSTYMAAICADARGNTQIYDCGVLSGIISSTSPVGYAGSITGRYNYSTTSYCMKRCFSYLTIITETGTSYVGGLVGYYYNSVMEKCFFDDASGLSKLNTNSSNRFGAYFGYSPYSSVSLKECYKITSASSIIKDAGSNSVLSNNTTNDSIWITAAANQMHVGPAIKVLRGVGNVVVSFYIPEVDKKLSGESGPTTSISATNKPTSDVLVPLVTNGTYGTITLTPSNLDFVFKGGGVLQYVNGTKINSTNEDNDVTSIAVTVGLSGATKFEVSSSKLTVHYRLYLQGDMNISAEIIGKKVTVYTYKWKFQACDITKDYTDSSTTWSNLTNSTSGIARSTYREVVQGAVSISARAYEPQNITVNKADVSGAHRYFWGTSILDTPTATAFPTNNLTATFGGFEFTPTNATTQRIHIVYNNIQKITLDANDSYNVNSPIRASFSSPDVTGSGDGNAATSFASVVYGKTFGTFTYSNNQLPRWDGYEFQGYSSSKVSPAETKPSLTYYCGIGTSSASPTSTTWTGTTGTGTIYAVWKRSSQSVTLQYKIDNASETSSNWLNSQGGPFNSVPTYSTSYSSSFPTGVSYSSNISSYTGKKLQIRMDPYTGYYIESCTILVGSTNYTVETGKHIGTISPTFKVELTADGKTLTLHDVKSVSKITINTKAREYTFDLRVELNGVLYDSSSLDTLLFPSLGKIQLGSSASPTDYQLNLGSGYNFAQKIVFKKDFWYKIVLDKGFSLTLTELQNSNWNPSVSGTPASGQTIKITSVPNQLSTVVLVVKIQSNTQKFNFKTVDKNGNAYPPAGSAEQPSAFISAFKFLGDANPVFTDSLICEKTTKTGEKLQFYVTPNSAYTITGYKIKTSSGTLLATHNAGANIVYESAASSYFYSTNYYTFGRFSKAPNGSWGSSSDYIILDGYRLEPNTTITIEIILEPVSYNVSIQVNKIGKPGSSVATSTIAAINVPHNSSWIISGNEIVFKNMFNTEIERQLFRPLDYASYNGPVVKVNTGSGYVTIPASELINGTQRITKENTIICFEYTLKSVSLNVGTAIVTGSNTAQVKSANVWALIDYSGTSTSSVTAYMGDNYSLNVDDSASRGYELVGYYVSATPISNNGSISYSSLVQGGLKTVTSDAAIYYYAIFKARTLTVSFNLNNPPAPSGGTEACTLNGSSPVEITFGSTSYLTGVPTAYTNNGSYVFAGWATDQQGNNKYFNYSGTTLSMAKTTFDPQYTGAGAVTLYAVWTAAVVNFYYNPNGGTIDGSASRVLGTVSYNSNNYSSVNQPVRAGYTFEGWEYNNKTYISKTGVKLTWDVAPGAQEINLMAKWKAYPVEVKYNVGGGVFADGTTADKIGAVDFGTNNYTNVPQTPTRNGYEFLYYKYTYNTTTYYIYGQDNALNTVYNNSSVTTSVTFTAYWKLVDFNLSVVSTDGLTFTYDGLNHALKAETQTMTGVTYGNYKWQVLKNSVWVDIAGATSIQYNIKNVKDSGSYRVSVTATASAGANNTLTKVSSPIVVTILQAQLSFVQNEITNYLIKVFDNNNLMPSSGVTVEGIKNNDTITLTATYPQVDAGSNLLMIVSISTPNEQTGDPSNYAVPTVRGDINKYTIRFQASGDIFKYSDDTKQIPVNYTLNNQDNTFLTTHGFIVSGNVKTNRNVVGTYTFTDISNQLIVSGFEVKNSSGTNKTNNFAVVVEGQFKILSTVDSVVVNIRVVCDDAGTTTLSNAFSVSVVDRGYSILDILENEIVIIASKTFFQTNGTISITSTMLNNNYWIKSWSAKIDGVNDSRIFTLQSMLDYSILSTAANQIIIDLNVTRLKDVAFDYKLAPGETVLGITSTKYSYNQTVTASVQSYPSSSHALPTPNRDGWNFKGWFVDESFSTQIKSDTLWLYYGNQIKTLYAEWEMINPDIQRRTLDISKVYNAQESKLEFAIGNANQYIAYTYSWEYSANNVSYAAISGKTELEMNVKNVADSGYYRLKVVATSGKYTKTVYSDVITVSITKIIIYPSSVVTLDKVYDGNKALIDIMYNGPLGEVIIIKGEYTGSEAGSKILKTAFAPYIVASSTEDINNYQLNTNNISSESKILAKEITIAIGDANQKVFDGQVYTIIGTYNDTELSKTFGYTISTISAEVGVYNYTTEPKGLIIQFDQTNMNNNYSVTITGKITIVKETVTATLTGLKDVTFDGNSHVLTALILDSRGTQITLPVTFEYMLNGEVVSTPIVAGTYTVKAIFDEGDNYQPIPAITETLIIRQRAIYITLGTISKIYDAKLGVTSFNAQIYGNSAKTQTISSLVTDYNTKYAITLDVNFETIDVGQNKIVRVTFNSSNPNNDNYTIAANAFYGEITKKSATLTIGSSVEKQYDAKAFVVAATNIALVGIADEDISSFGGNLEFTNIINAGTYNVSSQQYVNNLTAHGVALLTNYNITGISGSVKILKAIILVTATQNVEYTYTGSAVVPYHTFVRQDGKLEPKPESLVLTYKEGATQLAQAPYKTGNYVATYTLGSADGINYEIITSPNTIAFSIIARQITLDITEQKTFDGTCFTYFIKNSDIMESSLRLGEGDSFTSENEENASRISTTSEDCGTYYIVDSSSITRNVTIYKGNVDVTQNYIVIMTGSLTITKRQIEFNRISVNTMSVYTGAVQMLTVTVNADTPIHITFSGSSEHGYIHSVTRTNVILMVEKTTNIHTGEDVKLAGLYSFMLELYNYEIVGNSYLTATISQKIIKTLAFNETDPNNKTFDGTNSFVSTIDNQLSGIYTSDLPFINIQGVYETKNANAANQRITFMLVCADEFLLNSYKLELDSQYVGKINPREIQLELISEEIRYFTDNNIELGASLFNVKDYDGSVFSLGEWFEGNISVKLYNVGEYDLLSNSSAIVNNLTANNQYGDALISNYNISFAGILKILKASIAAEISDNTHIYDAKAKKVTVWANIFNEKGEISNAIADKVFTVEYIPVGESLGVIPINAGHYKLVIRIASEYSGSYRLVDELGNEGGEEEIYQYMSFTELVILQRQIKINVLQEKSYNYDGNNKQYTLISEDIVDGTMDGTGGMLSAHAVDGYLSTNTNKGGRYELFEEQPSLDIDKLSASVRIFNDINSQDVTANYSILSYTATIIIGSIVSDIFYDDLNSLVYNAQNKAENGEIKITLKLDGDDYTIALGQPSAIGSITELKMFNETNYEPVSQAKNVGLYSVKISIPNVMNFTERVHFFAITEKQINSINGIFDKVFDGSSSVVGELSSDDIYPSDSANVTIWGTYMQDEFNPAFNAGTYNIVFTLTGSAKDNYSINVFAKSGTISKKDIKLALNSNVNIYYTGQEVAINIFEFNAMSIHDETIVNFIDRFSGNILVGVRNVGVYNLASMFSLINFDAIESISQGGVSLFTNYTIIGYEGTVTINKAQVTINTQKDTFIYNGEVQAVQYTKAIYNYNGQIVAEHENMLVDVVYSSQPKDVGEYSVTYAINSAYSDNYTLVNAAGQVTSEINYGYLTINKREIAVVLHQVIERVFTNNLIQYTLTVADVIDPTQGLEGGLVLGHTIYGTFTTNNSAPGIYSILNVAPEDFALGQITVQIEHIMSGLDDVITNYNIQYASGTIQINYAVAGEINTEHIDSLVYAKTDYVLSNDIYIMAEVSGQLITFQYNDLTNTFGKLVNLKYQGGATSTAIKAGNYTVELTIYGTSDYTDKVVSFEIKQKQIINVTFTANKTYDKTSAILGAISSTDICGNDEVIITANYITSPGQYASNAGVHDVEFELGGIDAFNYSNNITGKLGTILAKRITLELTGTVPTIYYTNEQIVINIQKFTAFDASQNQINEFTDNLNGNIIFKLFNAGTYNLAQVSAVDIIKDLTELQESLLTNYVIEGYVGSLTIEKAQLSVAVSELSKIYNATAQMPLFDAGIYNERGKITAENLALVLSVIYEQSGVQVASPVNAGSYDIKIGVSSAYLANYCLNVSGNLVQSFTYGQQLVIDKRAVSIELEQTPSPYMYNGEKHVYSLTLNDTVVPNGYSEGGICLSHTIVGTLTTNRVVGGIYKLENVLASSNFALLDITPKVKIMSGEIDVTSNYEIITYTATMIISSVVSGEIRRDNLDNLTYDKTNKVTSGLISVSFTLDGQEVTFTYGDSYARIVGKPNVLLSELGNGQSKIQNLQYFNGVSFENSDVAIKAGLYKFFISINDDVTYQNYEISFTIKQKEIKVVDITDTKIYDGLSTLNGNITAPAIENGDIVTFTGNYVDNMDANIAYVGSHNIKIEMAGADSSNYSLALGSIRGEITKRSIIISVTNTLEIVYSDDEQRVDVQYLVVGGLGIVSPEIMVGYITLLIKNAQTYNLAAVTIDTTSFDITKGINSTLINYDISFAGSVTIDALNVEIYVDTIDLTYNGQEQSIKDFIAMPYLAEKLQDEAKAAISISYSQNTINAGNYSAQISSSSANFVFISQTSVNFEINQKDLTINIGEVTYEFNPTHNHIAGLQQQFAVGIVEGQTLSGTFALKQNGLPVGEYLAQNDEILFENLNILFNGESSLSNYNIVGYEGKITIIAFTLTADNIFLTKTSYIYMRQDIVNELVVNFYDANNELKQITAANQTNGSFVLLDEAQAINVGSYAVRVSIPNVFIQQSDLDFTITPKEIKAVSYIANKNFNGTPYVLNANNSPSLVSNDVISGDTIVINGLYMQGGVATSDIGTHSIQFYIVNEDQLPQKNYSINITSSGEIRAINVTFTISGITKTYKSSGIYVLDYNLTNFNLTSGNLMGNHAVSGFVTITRVNYVGNLNISNPDITNFKIMDGETDQTKNYNITVTGLMTIEKAQISLDFDGILNYYNYAKISITINPIVVEVKVEDETLPLLSTQYIGINSTVYNNANGPTNYGEYKAVFTIGSEFYEIVGASDFEFTIDKAHVELVLGDIPNNIFYKDFNQPDPSPMQFKITTTMNDDILIDFTREAGESVGYYDLYIDKTDNDNYTVVFADGANADLFRILKAGQLTIEILDTPNNRALFTKIYDSAFIESIEITNLDFAANGEIVTGFIHFEKNKNVGSYSILSHELENLNYNTFNIVCSLQYTITPKAINVVSETGYNKVYDATDNFVNALKIVDDAMQELDTNIYPLSVSAKYSNSQVSSNIDIVLSFEGDLLTNYSLQQTEFMGEITKRSVTVTPKENQNHEYGIIDYEILYNVIDNEASAFYGNLLSEITGNLSLSGVSQQLIPAGDYLIKSSLYSDNLELLFVSGIYYTVNKKLVTVESESGNFNKVYDGNAIVTATVSLNGLLTDDEVNVNGYYYDDLMQFQDASVGANKIIVWTLTGSHANNYYTEISFGNITEKFVELNFVYSTFQLINEELMTGNNVQLVSLTYGLAISDSIGSLPNPMHEGYVFEGWYLDEQFLTPISGSTILESPIWEVDEASKTVYAKWTIKKFMLNVVSSTRVNGVYVTDTYLQGGMLSAVSAMYDYYQIVNLNGVAVANTGYEFIGFADDLTANVNNSYLESGVLIEASEKTIYAKFKPISVTINLDSNGGVFTRIPGWTFNSSNSMAYLDVEYNHPLGVEFPVATKTGYTFDGYVDSLGIIWNYAQDRIVDFATEIALYVNYQAISLELVLDANGGYFDNFDEQIWEVVQKDINNRAIIVKKLVSYDSSVAEIIQPSRAGWTFDKWSEDIDENTVWVWAEAKNISASWLENTYEVVVSAQHAQILAQVYDKDDSLIDFIDEELAVVADELGNLTVKVKTTYKLVLTVTDNQGYTFTNWASDYVLVDGSTDRVLEINGFTFNFGLEAVSEANDNNITVTVNDKKMGYATFLTKSTIDTGTEVDVAKTEQSVVITIVPNEGYQLYSWIVEANGMPYALSGEEGDLVRTLSDFVSDITIIITFCEKDNSITIISDSEKGLFDVNEVTELNQITLTAKTDTVIEITVKAKHGYYVDLDPTSWNFDTMSIQKGTFIIAGNQKVAIITFSGFTSDGTIVIPYVLESFTVKVVSVLYNSDMTEDTTISNIVTLNNNGNLTTLNSNETFTLQYLTNVMLTALNAKAGYTFYTWSASGTKLTNIAQSDGFNSASDVDLNFTVLKDYTIYVVYEINSQRVEFTVNNSDMGYLSVQNIDYISFVQEVKYGADSLIISAITNQGYQFVKWVVVEGENQIDYSIEPDLQVVNITNDQKFIAIFEGIAMTITINVVLMESDVFSDDEIDFARLLVNEDDITKQDSYQRTNTELTYTISTITGQSVIVTVDASVGYEYYGLISDPRLNFKANQNELSFMSLIGSATVTVYVVAKINTVYFKIAGKLQGGEIYQYTNNEQGVVETELIDNEKTLKVSVKTGGNAMSIVNAFTGYTIKDNPYFEKFKPSQQTSGLINEYSIGGVENVSGDIVIEIEIESQTYQITFQYEYAESPDAVISQIDFGETTFNPSLSADVTSPVRYQYVFVGWNSMASGNGIEYYFDESGLIYRYTLVDSEYIKEYGFYGVGEEIVSSVAGVDFDATLYAIWRLQTFTVDVVILPSVAINYGTLSYSELYPLTDGRYPVFADDMSQTIIGISYVPGYMVEISPPTALSGYTYYGWALQGGITDKLLITQGYYSEIMGEENLIVYLYYTFTIQTAVVGGGTATVSETEVIVNQSINLVAEAYEGYLFKEWTLDGNVISSDASTTTLATHSSTYIAVFVGREVNVIMENSDKAKSRIANADQFGGVYRVGDVIKLEIYDATYGYNLQSWGGTYGGTILSNNYVITAADYTRGYARFVPVMAPSTLLVRFVVKNSEGGYFTSGGQDTYDVTLSYSYNSNLTYILTANLRYGLVSLKLNGTEIDASKNTILIHQQNGFTVSQTNIIEAEFTKLLWIDSWQDFVGIGTEQDPYLITNEHQLAAMAYLINNNILVSGKISYNQAYYRVKANFNLMEKFWQPIGTEEHPFDGTFELMDYKVNELYLDKYYEVVYMGGLFGYIGQNAKFITGSSDYTVAIIMIASLGLLIVTFVSLLTAYIVVKKRRLGKLAKAQRKKIDVKTEDDDEELNT